MNIIGDLKPTKSIYKDNSKQVKSMYENRNAYLIDCSISINTPCTVKKSADVELKDGVND